MSQQGENYITPIFPLNAEKFINNETEDELYNQEGGAIRSVTKFLDKHRDKILGVFEKGYSSGLKLYLPSIDKIVVYPDPKNPYIVKKFEDLENDRWFPKDVQTLPIYFLYQFLYKTDLMDKAKDDPVIQKTLKYDEDKHQLLLEISIRLYILCYLLIFSQNDLCIDNVNNSYLFNRYIVKKEKDDLQSFLFNLRDRLNSVTDTDSTIQRCMFGMDIDNDDDFEIICNIMYQYALVTFMGRKNYAASVISKFQESYFFDSMRSFLDTMIGKAKATATATATPGTTTPPVPLSDCAKFKIEFDKVVADKTAVTENEILALSATNNKYTKNFIAACFTNHTVFPQAENYGFAVPLVSLKDTIKQLIDTKTVNLTRTKILLMDVFRLEKAALPTFPKVTTTDVLQAIDDLNKDPKETERVGMTLKKTPKFAFKAPADDCEWFSIIVDTSGKVKDRSQITPNEETIITSIHPSLDHAAMEACIQTLNATTPAPTPLYGFAGTSTTPPPPPPVTPKTCDDLKALLDDPATGIANKAQLTAADIAILTGKDATYTEAFIKACFAADATKFPPTTYGFAPVKPTAAQCSIVAKYVQGTIERKFIEATIQKFLKSDADAKQANLTLDLFKQCLTDINTKLQIPDYFKIEPTFQGSSISTPNYDIKDVPGDGWCFYHALLQSVGPAPAYPLLSPADAMTDNSTEAEVGTFIGEIKTYINDVDPTRVAEKANWEKMYDIVYGQGTYATYLTNLADPANKVWADPEYGIGQAVANILKAKVEIYRKIGTDLGLIQTYTPTVASTSTIKLHYINNNHYQLILDKVAPAQAQQQQPQQVQGQQNNSLTGLFGNITNADFQGGKRKNRKTSRRNNKKTLKKGRKTTRKNRRV